MLHEVVEYGRSAGIQGEAGFVPKTVRWLITFDSKGVYLGVTDVSGEEKKSRGREFPRVPHLAFSGDTPMRQFLVENAKYALLYDEEPPADDAPRSEFEDWEKLLLKRDYFLTLLRESAEVEPFLGVVAQRLRDEDTREVICRDLAEQTPKAKSIDNITFAEVTSEGVRIILETDTWQDWWRGHFPSLFEKTGGKSSDANRMRCLLSGELVKPARKHPKIKGLGGDVGGNVETTLVGFNLDAFCSYKLSQSANAAVSEDMAQQYVAALNNLIARRSHRLAGTKVVFWYVGEVREKEGEDPLAALFDPTNSGLSAAEEEEDERDAANKRREYDAVKRARGLLEAVESGKRPELRDARYCALTLSGNAGRVVVRDWMEGRFEDLVRNVNAWFDDLSIVRRDGSGVIPAHKFSSLLSAPVRDLKEIASPIVVNLWRSALYNLPISHDVMARTLARVKIDILQDEAARHARIGLLKSYCNRNLEMPAMTNELNEELEDPAYLCGRMMAILADIQRVALGDVGAGVVQRYYAAASATPGLILGRLVRLAQTGHLPKIDVGLRNWFDQQLADVWSKLNKRPPDTLSLQEQTLFAMGYYQQKAKRGATSTSQNKETTETEH